MSGSAGRTSYSLSGWVLRVVAPYELAGHNGKQFFVFHLVAKRPKGQEFEYYNCVFYIDFDAENADGMMAAVCGSLLRQENLITVHFQAPPAWNRITDPSYIITAIS